MPEELILDGSHSQRKAIRRHKGGVTGQWNTGAEECSNMFSPVVRYYVYWYGMIHMCTTYYYRMYTSIVIYTIIINHISKHYVYSTRIHFLTFYYHLTAMKASNGWWQSRGERASTERRNGRTGMPAAVWWSPSLVDPDKQTLPNQATKSNFICIDCGGHPHMTPPSGSACQSKIALAVVRQYIYIYSSCMNNPHHSTQLHREWQIEAALAAWHEKHLTSWEMCPGSITWLCSGLYTTDRLRMIICSEERKRKRKKKWFRVHHDSGFRAVDSHVKPYIPWLTGSKPSWPSYNYVTWGHSTPHKQHGL